jgi:phage-related protein
MTPLPEIRKKPLHWVGSSYRDLSRFPTPVVHEIGRALNVAQFGGKHPAAKPWKGAGAGVLEIVEDCGGNAYRAVYTVRFARAIYVIHVFQKKSRSGIKTPRTNVQLIHAWLRMAEADYETQYGSQSR